MSELSKDPAIKLFGRTIPLHEAPPISKAPELSAIPEKVLCKERKDTEIKSANSDRPNKSEEADPTSPIPSTSINQNEQEKGKEEEPCKNTSTQKPTTDQKLDEVKSDSEKPLKKPDKILPCPRCNSMDTKFCYYNNYNVNQPRHFCKNCQRYWTAGGTMRNVPVGAGRRKNKHPSSHYRHIMMSSEGLLHQQGIPLVGPPTKVISTGAGMGTATGTVLKFGTEVPLCESMATVLNIGEERKGPDLVRDEQSCAVSHVENKSHVSSVAGEKNTANGFCDGVSAPPMPCYPGPAIMYPWGPAIPFPFVPASLWGWPNGPGPWTMLWSGFTNGTVLPSSPSSNSSSSENGSPLGKHSREPSSQCEEKFEKTEKRNLWAPKTLRIVDPDEAAKSSIWATLGIKPDEGSMFKSFGTKENCQVTDSGPVLHANPAAFSRSQSFQERT